MTRPALSLAEAETLPRWRRPEALLALMTVGMTLAFATWMAALNNFAVEAAGFDGLDIGTLHMVREVPGLLAFVVVFLVAAIPEQRFALLSLAILGAGTAMVAELPSLQGLMLTTLIGSIGFHWFETVNQSLQLQWLARDRAPEVMGLIVGAGAGASLAVYGTIALAGWAGWLDWRSLYWAGGGLCLGVALVAGLAYPRFRAPHPQGRRLVLRRRYWLYYALVFTSGARRQIFVVFAAFMMVERFGFRLHEVTALFLLTHLANMLTAPLVGRAIARFGERAAIAAEHLGLALVFGAYAGVYFLDWPLWLALGLYVADHMLFAMAFAQRTYFQKIADPGDHAPTAAVAFTINHVAAVALPVPLGALWLVDPGYVYLFACGLATAALGLAAMVPRRPAPGRETAFAGAEPDAAPAA